MSRIERLGYIFHPSSYLHPIGHAAVEVFIAPNEDDWFFATRSATFPIVDDAGLGHLHIDLFIASLQLSDSYVHRLPAMDTDDSTSDERMAISHAIHGLRDAGEWPDNPPKLHQLVLDDQYEPIQAS